MNLFICYPKCSTCKKAREYLENHQIPFEERNIKENNPTYEELKDWVNMGISVDKMFNKSGLIYKNLKLKDQMPTMSLEDKLRLLSTDGMLVKRPILLTKNKILFGFKEKEYEEIL